MNQKFNKGITLIALVITIIVLLILAGVTINMVLGDDGIIGQATDAGKAQKEAEEKQAIQIATGEAKTSEYMGTMTEDEVEAKFDNPNMFDNVEGNNIPAYNNSIREVKVFGEGEDAKYLPIPKGMAWAFGEVDEGAVVVDSYGNEYVWVPVDDFNKFARVNEGNYQGILYDVKNDGTMQETTGYGSEPANLSNIYDNITNLPEFYDDLFQDEYNEMAESVKTYKGFYVGRYETGGFNSTKVVSKAGEDQASCTNVDWYRMYRMQKELYGESASVTSGMIYGAQWDAIMLWMKDVPNVTDSSKKFIKDSTGMGNYAEFCPVCDGMGCEGCGWYGQFCSTIKTGSNPSYCVKNIFDLAGNYWEYTQEKGSSSLRSFRGGYYAIPWYEAFARSGGDVPTEPDDGVSSRLQLYIK